MGLFSAIAAPFMATQQKRAAETAQRMGIQAQNQAYTLSDQLAAQFNPYLTQAQQELGAMQQQRQAPVTPVQTGYEGYLQRALAQAEGLDVGEGLSGADRIAFEDAQRQMNENLVSTGNLRSGAAGYANTELSRRVVADANERRFGRQLGKIGLLGQLQGQGAQQGLAGYQLGQANKFNVLQNMMASAGLSGQIGMQGLGMANQLQLAGLGMTPGLMQAEQYKGEANANMIGAYGQIGDQALNLGVGAALGGFGGLSGMSGLSGAAQGAAWNSGAGSSLMQYQLLQNLLNKQPATTDGGKYSLVGMEGPGYGYINNQGYGF